LQLESSLLKRKNQSPADSTVIIRADREAQAGQVQELIKMCQEAGFEQFALRAREDLDHTAAP
jgi:biopolymer transport protein ExbD